MQGSLPRGRKLLVLIGLAGAFVVPQAAEAEITSALGVGCTIQADGVRFCGSTSPRSTAPAFDGVPIDVNVAFPPEPASGPDGNFPLMMMFHGYGGGKIGLSAMQRWLDRGYATFSMTDRGFHESCGSAASQSGVRRRVRRRLRALDRQPLRGPRRPGVRRAARRRRDGLIDPQRIGAIGGSYGGGMSMALGALRNRVVMPDYSLVPWTSPAGKPMQIAAAAPNIPWTDLAYSLAPNGSTLDYVADAPYTGPGRGREAVVRRRPLRRRAYRAGLLRARGQRPDRRPRRLAQRDSRPASPTGADAQAILAEIDRAPLLVLHRPLDRARADADVERVHRRPVPGRRDDPLLQPHPHRVPGGRQPGALLRRLRPPAGGEQERRHHRPARTRERLDGLLRQGRRLRAGGRGHRLHPDLPQHRTVGRPVLGQELGADRQGRDPARRRRARRRSSPAPAARRSRPRSTRSAAAGRARPPTAPTSRGPRATGSSRRPRAATR